MNFLRYYFHFYFHFHFHLILRKIVFLKKHLSNKMASQQTKEPQWDTVYIMNDDKSLIDIGSIESVSGRILLKNEGYLPSSVLKFNKLMFDIIHKDEGYDTDVNIDIEAEDIKGKIIYIMRYRRCTVYLVIQTSALGTRLLAYLYSKIKHSAQSFGTGCHQVDKKDILKHFPKDLLEKYKFGL